MIRAGLRHALRVSCASQRLAVASSRAQLTAHQVPSVRTSNMRFFSAAAPRQSSHIPERGNYKTLTEDDITHFASILPATSILTTIPSPEKAWVSTTADDLILYNNDWMDKYKGHSKLVLKVKSVEQASQVMKYCYEQNIAVVPQGGNTGLVGGSVPVYDEVVVSLEGLNQIREFDDVSGILTCDAGCILENLSTFLEPKGYLMPLDLGAKGSCQIGGNVATNAGGLRLLRYGSLHGTVLGLEVVLADGTLLSVGMGGPDNTGATALRKDNTGYDLKQLFIGSEGTLGIITGVSILTPKLSTAQNVSVLKVPSFAAIETIFRSSRDHLGEILSAFEFFDKEGMDLVLHHTSRGSVFESEDAPDARSFYVLIETSGSNKDHDDEKLGNFLEYLLENEIITDGILAQDETQVKSLWSLRELLPEAAGKLGKVYKYDLSMKVQDMYSLVEEARQRFIDEGISDEILSTTGYGHIGDGNLHINIIAKSYNERVENAIEPWIYEATARRAGSISAEHGLGLMKAPHLHYSKSPEAIVLMQQIKKIFDAKNILNPYKYVV